MAEKEKAVMAAQSGADMTACRLGQAGVTH
jgi:hypothetical protein